MEELALAAKSSGGFKVISSESFAQQWRKHPNEFPASRRAETEDEGGA